MNGRFPGRHRLGGITFLDMAIDDAVERPTENLRIDELGERLDALRLLRERDDAGVESILESLGSQGPVEAQMLTELSNPAPLRHPERFDEAHRRAMRALEVFDRNGIKAPSSLKAPEFIKGIAGKVVQLLIHVIVRGHQQRLIKEVRQLYALREATAAIGSDEHRMLAKARRHMDTIVPELSKSSLPLPAFLVGGAAVSGTVSFLQRGLADDWGRLIVLTGFAVLGLAGFWCIIQAAAIARRRTRIALDATFLALWEVIGDAGTPPRDRTRVFAVIGSAVLIAVWILVPLLIALVWATL